eukprot:TRINITY_DN22781_c0_g1_i1.p1 TRINITY_DN22781_c0_g1~~TRINITY_DN22781_c0_g1_i1.p1  ORF type:complete len:132 (+),score=35.66 TRINITY_DN22781_c0_g1_i1:58-453(+)
MGATQSNIQENTFLEEGGKVDLEEEMSAAKEEENKKERAAIQIAVLKKELETQKKEIRELITQLEKSQRAEAAQNERLAQDTSGAAIGRRWVGMLTEALCRRCQEEATPQQLGTHLIVALRELILECPTGA